MTKHRHKITPDHPVLPLNVQHLEENVTITDDQVVAWFRLGPQAWQWRGDNYRNQVLRDATRVWATLATLDGLPDRHIHLRVTQRPYPAHEWAAAVSAITPQPANPKAWRDRLVATQRRMRSSTLSDTEVFVGVPVADRKTVDRLNAAARRSKVSNRERARIKATIANLTAVLDQPGFRATPVTQTELEWLMHRSVGLGLPEPMHLPAPDGRPVTADDIATFYNTVDVDPRPFQRSIRVTGYADRNGVDVTRHVAVLTLGRMENLTIPEQAHPWVAVSEQLPFPVEWSLRFELRSGTEAADDMTKKLQMVEDQVTQHRKHSIEIPLALRRTSARAVQVGDEMSQGHRTAGARYTGHFRIAVWGKDDEEVAARVRAVKNLYESMHIDVEWERGQHGLYREFIPGEALSSTNHTRRGPVSYLSGAVPNLASRIGDRRGDYVGFTASTSRRTCCWDPHYGIEVLEGPGLTPVLGGLGAGKSGVTGGQAYSAALRGINTTVLDPSGPLARLCYLPALAGVARHVDLLQSEPGTLSPYACVPEPKMTQIQGDPRLKGLTGDEREARARELWNDARDAAARTRQQLAIDVLRLLLPPEWRGQDGASRRARTIIADAVRTIGGTYLSSSLNSVLGVIREDPRDEDHEIFNLLNDMRQNPQSRLFFGAGYSHHVTHEAEENEPTLLVFTMAGLTLPDEQLPEANWGEQERIAVPLLTLAAHYTSKRIYSRPMWERKLVALDEAHFLRNIPSGRALVDRLARDSRKWTTRVLLATQKCADLEQLNARGLIKEIWAGRIDDFDEAQAFLRLAGIPTGVGYEAEMANLSGGRTGQDTDPGYREFVFRDATGNTEVVRIDIKDHQPDLFAALRTQRRDDQAPTDPPLPSVDELEAAWNA